MPAPDVTQAELQRVHRALRVAVPLDQASPLILTTLAVVARCWRKRGEPAQLHRPAARPLRLPVSPSGTSDQPVDLKRRAAGDID
jgi:hypothetical protein